MTTYLYAPAGLVLAGLLVSAAAFIAIGLRLRNQPAKESS